MFAARAFPNVARTARTQIQARGYASAAGGGSSSNLPMILAAAGLAGLGGYVYLDRNPSAKAALESNINEAKGHANELKDAAASKIVSPNEKAAAGGGENVIGALIKDKWVDFELEKVEPYNHNTSIYHFKLPGDDQVAGLKVASALLVKASDSQAVVDDKGKPVIRPYTPVSGPDSKGKLELMVKNYPTGKMTPHIASLKPGQTLAFKGPIQKFLYNANEIEHGLCLAGGSGITPMYQVISHALSLPEDKTKFTLLFSNVTEKDILLRKEFDALAKSHPDRFKVVYVLDKAPWGWKGETGYMTKEMIEKYLPKDGSKTKAFVCGPPGQVNSLAGPKDGPRQGPIIGVLEQLKFDNDTVFKF